MVIRSTPSVAGPTGLDVLRRAATASRSVAYRGVRMTTLWLEGRTEGVECVEMADGHGRFRVEYSAPASARGRVVVSDGKCRWQIEPGGRRVFRNDAPPIDADVDWNVPLLSRNYEVRLAGRRTTVARRPVYRLDLEPKHRGLPRRGLWIDTQTLMVLRRDVRNADGTPCRWSSFTEIAFKPAIQESQFQCRPQAGGRVVQANTAWRPLDTAAAGHLLGAPVAIHKEIPSLGFALYGLLGRQTGARTVHLVYEDGVSTLSLFVDDRANDVAMRGARRLSLAGHPAVLRSDHHFAVLRWSIGRLRYTLMGDLTPDALIQAGSDLSR